MFCKFIKSEIHDKKMFKGESQPINHWEKCLEHSEDQYYWTVAKPDGPSCSNKSPWLLGSLVPYRCSAHIHICLEVCHARTMIAIYSIFVFKIHPIVNIVFDCQFKIIFCFKLHVFYFEFIPKTPQISQYENKKGIFIGNNKTSFQNFFKNIITSVELKKIFCYYSRQFDTISFLKALLNMFANFQATFS